VLDTRAENPVILRGLRHKVTARFYVENLLTSSENLSVSRKLQEQVSAILAQNMLVVQKWFGTHKELLGKPQQDLQIFQDDHTNQQHT
jgi:hypothetical protein